MAISGNDPKIKVDLFIALDNKTAIKSIEKLTEEIEQAQKDIETRGKAIATSRANVQGKSFKKLQRNLRLSKLILATKQNELQVLKVTSGSYKTIGRSIKDTIAIQKQMNAQTESAAKLMQRVSVGKSGGGSTSGGEKASAAALTASNQALINSKKKVVKWTAAESQSSKALTPVLDANTAATKKNTTARKHLGAVASTLNKVRIVAQFALGAKVIQGFTETLSAAGEGVKEFDTATRTMSAVLDISLSRARGLGQGLNDLGKTLGGSQKEIYDVALALGRAGVATEDLVEASEVAIRMAILTGDSFNESTKAIISYQQVFGKDEMGNVLLTVGELGDKLAFVANVSRLSTQDIGTFSNFALAAAKNVGLTVDAVGALAASFSNAGVNASTIGTQIRSLTRIFVSQSQGVETLFKKLGVVQANVLKDLQSGPEASDKAIQKFAQQLKQLSDRDFANFTSGLNKLEANALALLRQQSGNFSKFLNKSINGVKGQLAETDVILKGFAVTWETNMNKMRDVAIDVFSPVADFFKNAISFELKRADLFRKYITLSSEEFSKYKVQAHAKIKLQLLINKLENTSENDTARRAELEIQILDQHKILGIEEDRLKTLKKQTRLQELVSSQLKLQRQIRENEKRGGKDQERNAKVLKKALEETNASVKAILNSQLKGSKTLKADLVVAEAFLATKDAQLSKLRRQKKFADGLGRTEGKKYAGLLKSIEAEKVSLGIAEGKITRIKALIAQQEKLKKATSETTTPIDLELFSRVIQNGNKAGADMVDSVRLLKDLGAERLRIERGYLELIINSKDVLGEKHKPLKDIVDSAKDELSISKALADLTTLRTGATEHQSNIIDETVNYLQDELSLHQSINKGVQSQTTFEEKAFNKKIMSLNLNKQIEALQKQFNLGSFTALGFEHARLKVMESQVIAARALAVEAAKSGNKKKTEAAKKALGEAEALVLISKNAILSLEETARRKEEAAIQKQNKLKYTLESEHLKRIAALRRSASADSRAIGNALGGGTPEFRQYQADRNKLQQDTADSQPFGPQTKEVTAQNERQLEVFDQSYADKVESGRGATSIASGPSQVKILEDQNVQRLAAIRTFYDQKREIVAEGAAGDLERARLNEEEETAIARTGLQTRLAQTGTFASQGAQILEDLRAAGLAKGRSNFEAMKALQIASATINTYTTANAAYAAAFIPPTPASPVIGAISAAAAIAAGLANVAQIKAQTYHTGGMVGPTGTKLRGDEVPAILQTGEQVLSRNEVAQAKTAPDTPNETVIVNSMDPAVIESWASSRAGRKVIRNIVNN